MGGGSIGPLVKTLSSERKDFKLEGRGEASIAYVLEVGEMCSEI